MEKPAPPKERRDQKQPEKKTQVRFSYAVPAKVEEVIGRTGTRGDAIQVRCRVLDGRDKGKSQVCRPYNG